MRYVEARLTEYTREQAYRLFVTRSLQLAPQGQYITTSFGDILNPQKVDNRTGDEIAIDVMKKAGLSFR